MNRPTLDKGEILVISTNEGEVIGAVQAGYIDEIVQQAISDRNGTEVTVTGWEHVEFTSEYKVSVEEIDDECEFLEKDPIQLNTYKCKVVWLYVA